MRIAMDAAKFTDAEVNELRKAMATFRRRGTIGLLEEKMVSQMVARGYDPAFAALAPFPATTGRLVQAAVECRGGWRPARRQQSAAKYKKPVI
jgi:hypothetical protein